MTWYWGYGWLGVLISVLFWIALIGVAVWLLQRELPNFRPRNRPPALDLLEERYARGEIDREEFLERRAVLLGTAHRQDEPWQTDAPPPTGPAASLASERPSDATAATDLEQPSGATAAMDPEPPSRPTGGEPTEQLPREQP